MAWGRCWRRLAAGLLIVGLGLALLAHGPDPAASRSAEEIVVGDLKLADDDEPPGDGVSQTFQASNLAPGDTYASELEILRAEEDLPRGIDPRVTVRIETEDATSALASHLAIAELAYDEKGLRGEAREACGEPLTFGSLAECTQTSANPLTNLSDPTTEGRPLVIGIELRPEAGDESQGQSLSFTVEVELYAEPPRSLDPDTTRDAKQTADDPGPSDPNPVDVPDERRALEAEPPDPVCVRDPGPARALSAPLVGERIAASLSTASLEDREVLVDVLFAVHLPNCSSSSPSSIGSTISPRSSTLKT